mgnify:CR=1 FL=1
MKRGILTFLLMAIIMACQEAEYLEPKNQGQSSFYDEDDGTQMIKKTASRNVDYWDLLIYSSTNKYMAEGCIFSINEGKTYNYMSSIYDENDPNNDKMLSRIKKLDFAYTRQGLETGYYGNCISALKRKSLVIDVWDEYEEFYLAETRFKKAYLNDFEEEGMKSGQITIKSIWENAEDYPAPMLSPAEDNEVAYNIQEGDWIAVKTDNTHRPWVKGPFTKRIDYALMHAHDKYDGFLYIFVYFQHTDFIALP